MNYSEESELYMLEKIKAPSTETTFANASEHGSR